MRQLTTLQQRLVEVLFDGCRLLVLCLDEGACFARDLSGERSDRVEAFAARCKKQHDMRSLAHQEYEGRV